jgi:hypothetical protein
LRRNNVTRFACVPDARRGIRLTFGPEPRDEAVDGAAVEALNENSGPNR